MFLFLMLVLRVTAVTAQLPSVIIKDGDEVALPCENVINNQDKCDKTDWILQGSRIIDLVKQGKITEDKSDRLSVAENCSLVIKKVTPGDAAQYHCQQGRQGQSAQVYLSVVNMTEQEEDDDKVTLYCDVSTYEGCIHTVKWLYDGKNVAEGNKDFQASGSGCSASVTFPSSRLKQKPKSQELFKCEVTDGYNREVHLFPYRPQSSDEITATATTTTTTGNGKKSTQKKTVPTITGTSPKSQSALLLYVGLAVGLAALLITAAAVVIWKRTKGNKTPQPEENIEQRLNPAETQPAPETSQDPADPEDGVSYASISYIKKSSGEAQVRVKDDDEEGDAVTYSTVKASSSSAGASADPSDVYSAIKKPDRKQK